MNYKGPIVIIEDDQDDRDILSDIFNELAFSNEIVFLNNGAVALEYLQRDDVFPFLVMSDINMPFVNGFELREQVQASASVASKTIPYLFLTTTVNKEIVEKAYKLSVQGIFLKPDSFRELKEMMTKIVGYWQQCYSPGNYGK